jgi:hypothetical protein
MHQHQEVGLRVSGGANRARERGNFGHMPCTRAARFNVEERRNMLLIATALGLALQVAAVPVAPIPATAATFAPRDTDSTVVRPRPRPVAVEYSDWYYRRLQIHRWGSYLELPIFAAEYVLGQKLIDNPTDGVRTAHQFVAGALGTLFVVNTVTGVWNLKEGWSGIDQKGLIATHSVLMLAADAGFVATGVLAAKAHDSVADRNRHRNVAIASMSVATVSTAVMWLMRR